MGVNQPYHFEVFSLLQNSSLLEAFSEGLHKILSVCIVLAPLFLFSVETKGLSQSPKTLLEQCITLVLYSQLGYKYLKGEHDVFDYLSSFLRLSMWLFPQQTLIY